MNDVSAFPMAEATFKACQLAHQFINARVRPRAVQALEAAPSDANTFYGALLRVVAWTHTLSKLNEPIDFQAGIVASRTLFEIALDVTLMHFDPTTYPPAKLLAWEDSSKLKAAEKIRDYFHRHGEQPTIEFEPHVRYIATNTARIGTLRAAYWNGKHPGNRWTGRNLRDDARAATQLFSGGKFEQFYDTRYPQICWNTHGSGIAGIRNVRQEHFPGLSAFAFQACIEFALVAAEIVLRQFGLWDAATAGEFDDAKTHRIVTAYATMAGL